MRRVGDLGLKMSVNSELRVPYEVEGQRRRTSTKSATAASVAACENLPKVAYSAKGQLSTRMLSRRKALTGQFLDLGEVGVHGQLA